MPMLTPIRSSLPSITYGAETISISLSASAPAAADSVELRLHDREFIPAEARDQIDLARRLLQSTRHLLQQQIAGVVPEGVVDFLEAIQIQIQHREARWHRAAPRRTPGAAGR